MLKQTRTGKREQNRHLIRQIMKGSFDMSKVSIIKEFWDFIKERKKFILAPILFVLILLSLLVIFAKSSSVAPFIYTLF